MRLFIDDAPVASNVFMPGGEWEYVAFDQVPQFHMDPNKPPHNMAFELLTLDRDHVGLDGVVTSTFSFFTDTDIAQAVPRAKFLGQPTARTDRDSAAVKRRQRV